MYQFLQKHYLTFRDFFFTQEMLKFGESNARSGYKFGLYTLVFFPSLYGPLITILIATQFGFRHEFHSEGEEAKWVLLLSGILIAITYLIHRGVYSFLVPPNEPLVRLEEPLRKKYLKLYFLYALGPLLLFFLLIFVFYFPF